jgi:hypothetical protein
MGHFQNRLFSVLGEKAKQDFLGYKKKEALIRSFL